MLALAACRMGGDARQARPAAPSDTPPHAEAAAPDPSAVAFVREFYATYAPRLIPNGLQAVDSIIVERPSLFAPALLAALRRDGAVRDTAAEMVGLDFDPFLNTQDGCERYEVGEATRAPDAAANVLVSVYEACSDSRGRRRAAVVEVTPAGGSWAIANLHYEQLHDDLLHMLRDDPAGR